MSPPPLEVLTDPKSLAAAVESGKQHVARLQAYLLSHPWDVKSWDHLGVSLLSDPEGPLRRGFLDCIHQSFHSPQHRAYAAAALLSVDDARAIAPLRRLCESVTNVDDFLFVAGSLGLEQTMSEFRSRTTQQLVTEHWLLDFINRWLPQVRPDQLYRVDDIPSTTGLLTFPLNDRGLIFVQGERQARKSYQLQPTPEKTQAIIRTFEASDNHGGPWFFLPDVPLDTPPPLRDKLLRYSRDSLLVPLPYFSTSHTLALNFIKKHDPDARATLTTIAERGGNSSMRAEAITLLADIDRAAAIDLAFRSYFDDLYMRPCLAGFVEKHFAGTQDDSVISILASSEAVLSDPHNRSEIVRAILAIGGPTALPAARYFLPNLTPSVASTVDWLDRGYSAEQVVRRATELGLILSEPGKSVTAPSNPLNVVELLRNSNLYHSFDPESFEVPPRYDNFLLSFAKATHGAFNPTSLYQDYFVNDRDDVVLTHYTVQFIHDNRVYRFHPNQNGDWFDVEATVTSINRALLDSGSPRLFLPLLDGSQFIFANPAALQAFAKEFKLPLTDDLNSAVNAGIAFENLARNLLNARSTP